MQILTELTREKEKKKRSKKRKEIIATTVTFFYDAIRLVQLTGI